ncbi:hypothetical protein OXX59_000515 [Metschnikowia pulcherrima]
MSHKLQTLARHPGRFSLTVDEWNSGNNYDFLAVALHYFDVSFSLVDVAIGFEVLNKNISYTGEALIKSLDDVLTQYDIKSRIISITRDNAGPMNALLDIFAKERNKNVGETDLGFSRDISEEDDTVRNRNSGPETLLKDNETRWLSTLRMLERFIYFREQITVLLILAENVKVSKRLKLEAYTIEDDKWKYLETICKVLKIFEAPTKMLQGSNFVTLNNTIPVVSDILQKLGVLKDGGLSSSNHLLQLGLESALDKLREYYPIHKDEIGPIKNLYLATVLDPRLKIAALQDCGISDSAITNVEEYFHEVYSVYKANIDERNTRPELVGARRIGQSAFRVGLTNNDLLGNLFARRNQPESSSDEVKRYLSEEQQDTIFDFYAARRNTFPVISQMARDFLAIPAMSASSERIFSKVGDLVTRKRNRLQPGTIKMLAILKARDLVVDEESTVCDVAEGAKSMSDNIIDKENEKQDEDGELEAITIEDSDTSEDDDEALVTVFIPEN